MCVLLFVHVLRKRSRFGGFPCLIVRRKLTPGHACIAELQTRAAKQNKKLKLSKVFLASISLCMCLEMF